MVIGSTDDICFREIEGLPVKGKKSQHAGLRNCLWFQVIVIEVTKAQVVWTALNMLASFLLIKLKMVILRI